MIAMLSRYHEAATRRARCASREGEIVEGAGSCASKCSFAGPEPAKQLRGEPERRSRVTIDSIKLFRLTAVVLKRQIAPHQTVDVSSFNGSAPGPTMPNYSEQNCDLSLTKPSTVDRAAFGFQLRQPTR